jgi:hypothetical protein
LCKADNLLIKAEALPEYAGCADKIHRARLQLEKAMVELDQKKSLDWSLVSGILEFLNRLLTVLKLLGLGVINFCQVLLRNKYEFA